MTEAGTESAEPTAFDEIVWHRFHTYPGFLGFVCSEKAFSDGLKRLGIEQKYQMTSGERNGSMHTLVNADGVECYVITFNMVHGPHDSRFLALLAHEAMHVIQAVWRNTGEENPGKEAEAYLMQFIFSFCMEHYEIAYNAKRGKNVHKMACCNPVKLTQV